MGIDAGSRGHDWRALKPVIDPWRALLLGPGTEAMRKRAVIRAGDVAILLAAMIGPGGGGSRGSSETNCSIRGDVVLDPFLATGSTLMAAERAGRICRGTEIAPSTSRRDPTLAAHDGRAGDPCRKRQEVCGA